MPLKLSERSLRVCAAGGLPASAAVVAAAGTVGAGSAAAAYNAVDHDHDHPPSSTSPTWAAIANDAGSAPHGTSRALPNGMTTFANATAQPAAEQDDAVVPPTKDASMDEIKAWVDHQLDLIGTTPVLNRFVMLGPHERRRGGAPLATSAASTMSRMFMVASNSCVAECVQGAPLPTCADILLFLWFVCFPPFVGCTLGSCAFLCLSLISPRAP